MSITETFSRTGREQLSRTELISAGVVPAVIGRAVRTGKLRAGVTGYWLPRAADPGAAYVMRNAMSGALPEGE